MQFLGVGQEVTKVGFMGTTFIISILGLSLFFFFFFNSLRSFNLQMKFENMFQLFNFLTRSFKMPQKDLVSLCVSAGTFSCQGLSVLICIRLCILIRRNGVRNSLRASQYQTLLLLLYLMAAAIKKQLKHKWYLQWMHTLRSSGHTYNISFPSTVFSGTPKDFDKKIVNKFCLCYAKNMH